jgi:long-chain fatty acid transport protein
LRPIINQKKVIMRRFTVLLLFFCLAATTTFGGGYQVGLHSVRNIGMGLIGTSLSYDASTLFYNPGGAAFVNEKWSFTGGVSFLMARTTFQAKDVAYQANLKHQLNTPLYFYAAFKPTKNLSVGLAVNTPYGNSLGWDDNWKGRFLIQNLSFKAFTFQPTVSYKFGDIIGIGVGLVYAYGSVELNKAIPINGSTGEGSLNIKGTAGNFGFNAGVMVHPVKGLSLGLDFRSKIQMKVKGGTPTFSLPQSVAPAYPYDKVDVMLPLPANLDFGASYETGNFMIGLNLCYVFWSTYDSLVFNFTDSKTNAQMRSASPAMYQNRIIPRIGAQYRINKLLTVRVGGYYDPSPVPSDYLNPQTPSLNQIGLTCGLSLYPTKGLSIDAAFLYVMGAERSGTFSPDNFAGSYRNGVYCPGIGLTYNF